MVQQTTYILLFWMVLFESLCFNLQKNIDLHIFYEKNLDENLMEYSYFDKMAKYEIP